MVFDFEVCKSFSQIGVNNVVGYLKSLDETLLVIDVGDDPEYQCKDIDLLWRGYRTDYLGCSVEVKADSHSTGNIVLEVLSNEEQRVLGWLYKSCADYLFYNFVNERDLHIFKLSEMRCWFESRKDAFKKIRVETRRKNGFYTTVSHLVPADVLQKSLNGVYVRLA